MHGQRRKKSQLVGSGSGPFWTKEDVSSSMQGRDRKDQVKK